jgi:hypothetical protein
MRTCSFCKAPLMHRNFKKPYQLVMRFIIGYSCAFSPHTGLALISHADMVFSVLCDTCATVPMVALLMITELDYPIIAHAIEQMAFYQRVNMSRFTHYARHSFNDALVQSLLLRCSCH